VGAIVAFLILTALGAGAYILASGLLGGNETPVQAKVPNVVGFTQAAAESALRDAGFKPKVETQVTTDAAAVGNVVKQTPEASALADKGSEVTITVGKAPRQVTVPSVIGLAQPDAEKALTDAGLKVGTVDQRSDPADPGTVIAQSIEPDTSVDKGTTVDLIVSSGPQQVTVPDFVCDSLGHAQSELGKQGFQVVIAQGTEYNAACPTPGKVAAMDPAPGTSVNAGDTITLIESTNESPPPTESPSPTESPTP
jgi:serine/threonine-protein kinase